MQQRLWDATGRALTAALCFFLFHCNRCTLACSSGSGIQQGEHRQLLCVSFCFIVHCKHCSCVCSSGSGMQQESTDSCLMSLTEGIGNAAGACLAQSTTLRGAGWVWVWDRGVGWVRDRGVEWAWDRGVGWILDKGVGWDGYVR